MIFEEIQNGWCKNEFKITDAKGTSIYLTEKDIISLGKKIWELYNCNTGHRYKQYKRVQNNFKELKVLKELSGSKK